MKISNRQNIFISKLAKVVSDKPAYKKKVKTDNGYVWVYDDKHVEKRWQEKKNKLKNLNKNIEKLRKAYEKDLTSDDLRTRALAAIVGIMDDTAMRVGNEDSAKEADTYGATTLKVKHLNFGSGKAIFKFVGKDNVKQNVFTNNKKIISVLKELVKNKKDNEFIFEIDGVKIWDRAVNRYLAPFKISAKDIRGFQANKLMEEALKKKDWKEALEEVADTVGHKPSTLKNQYLDPDLVHKHDVKKTAFISKRAMLSEKEKEFFDMLKSKLQSSVALSNQNSSGVKTNDLIDNVWAQLYPHIGPLGAKMTSAIRSQEDQIRIINNYWASSGAASAYPTVKDINSMVKVLSNMGYVINEPENTPHLSGKSFDVSGPNIETIAEKIRELTNTGQINAKLKVLVEPKNNAVHIDIIRASKEFNLISKLATKINIDKQIKDIYEDLANSDAEPEIIKEYGDIFKLEWKDKIPGGLADKKRPEDFDQKQLEKGIKVELEHVNDKQLAKEIAMDHLMEDSKYYNKLEKMEEKFGSISIRADEKPEVDIPEEQKQNDMGFGKDDQMGDWFEKSPMFRHKEIPEESVELSEADAGKLANSEPEKFFYRGLHKQYPNLEIEALKNMLKTNAKFYFIFKYNEREDNFKELLQSAAEALSQQDVRAFFYYYLHQKFPELGRGAIIQLIDTNPDSFFDLGLDKDYPDYIESANNARNIKDPNKVELEQPEWLKSETGKALSIRDKNANVVPMPMTDEYTVKSDSKNKDIISKERAIEIIDGARPSSFLTHTEAIKLYPDLKYRAIQNIIEKEPTVYFINKIYQNPQFKEFNRPAILKLLEFKPHMYFTMGLFDTEEFKDFIDGAMFSLINRDPKFFIDVILPMEEFKEFHNLKETAKNSIKKASLSKRAGDIIELSGIPNSIIDDLKTLPGEVKTLNYHTMNNEVPIKTSIIDTVRGNIILNDNPNIYIFWTINSYKLEPGQPPDKHYKVAVHLVQKDGDQQQVNDQILREYGPKLAPLVEKLKSVVAKLQANWKKIIDKKQPGLLNNNVIRLFPKEAAVQNFPKVCELCHKEYNNYEEFFNQSFRGEVKQTITLDDQGLQCQEEWGTPGIDFVYRDCDCGSTLIVKIPCLHRRSLVEASLSKRAKKKKHESAGVFIVVPKDLAKKFPSLGEHDDSKPHITALYVGVVPKKHIELLEETVKSVCAEQRTFEVNLDEKVSYFPATKHSDNCKVAKLKIISDDLHDFHKKLKKAIKKAGIEIDDHFPIYKPHITLEYMPEGQEKYDGDVPSGSWIVESVEIWNGDNKKRFRLGGKVLSKRASDSDELLNILKKDYPDISLKPYGALVALIKEWIPYIVHRYMITSNAVKVCSDISPAFAVFANEHGFPTFIKRSAGHVNNVVLTSDGPMEVDLSAIQFEFCASNSDEEEKKELTRLLDKVKKDPLSAIKIKKYNGDLYSLEVGPLANKAIYFTPKQDIESAKKYLERNKQPLDETNAGISNRTKEAAKIDYPKKMFEEISQWINTNSEELKRKLLVIPGKKYIEKIFDLDISDTDQYSKHNWISKMFYLEKYNNKLVVRLLKDGPENEGMYRKQNGMHEITIYDAIKGIKSGEIYITLKHELIHMMQMIMTGLIQIRNELEQKPEYSGFAGLPKYYDPKTFNMRIDPEESILSQSEITKRHSLADVEFFTRLNDEIEYFKKNINVAGTEDSKKLLENFMAKSKFLNILKEHDYEKYKRAIREIYRALNGLIY